MQRHALMTVEAGKDDLVPETDEVLLEELTRLVKDGNRPTLGDVLGRARQRDPSTFEKWHDLTVSNRLKNYGIARPKKIHGERRYRDVSLHTLYRIQTHYGIDLGIPGPHPQASSPIDPCVTHGQGDRTPF
jgi:hypothetical protein